MQQHCKIQYIRQHCRIQFYYTQTTAHDICTKQMNGWCIPNLQWQTTPIYNIHSHKRVFCAHSHIWLNVVLHFLYSVRCIEIKYYSCADLVNFLASFLKSSVQQQQFIVQTKNKQLLHHKLLSSRDTIECLDFIRILKIIYTGNRQSTGPLKTFFI